MKNYFLLFICIFIFCFSIFFTFRFSFSNLPRLKVMVYSSFLSPYGPAVELQKKFESQCQCHLRWMKVEDSTLMVQRLELREDGLGVDVVFGLDQMTLFSEKNMWKDFSFPQQEFNEIGSQWVQKVFQKKKTGAVPIAWAPLTFISRKSESQVTGLQDLLHSRWEKQISLPHPRSSTLGLQFYFWLWFVFEENLYDFLKSFKSQVYTFSHSWSGSYGLFQKEVVDLTFSYQTSLVYHFVEESKNYSGIHFSEGHPYQVEFAVIPQTCRECELSQKFIRFLLQRDVQKILMEKNYMLPIVKNVEVGTPFEKLPKLNLISYKKMDAFLNQKKNFLQKF